MLLFKITFKINLQSKQSKLYITKYKQSFDEVKITSQVNKN